MGGLIWSIVAFFASSADSAGLEKKAGAGAEKLVHVDPGAGRRWNSFQTCSGALSFVCEALWLSVDTDPAAGRLGGQWRDLLAHHPVSPEEPIPTRSGIELIDREATPRAKVAQRARGPPHHFSTEGPNQVFQPGPCLMKCLSGFVVVSHLRLHVFLGADCACAAERRRAPAARRRPPPSPLTAQTRKSGDVHASPRLHMRA